ncbi:DNA methyltransferase [Loktanella sp. 3ANDIMAR09]|uniref:DNA-methyltransferase n=1 Tax=Loktanella sp. 3ANDIMAR09 TaxID=1225657 RepID=UPI0006F5F9BB|nr:DNA methyltransferase [Loktanella sp. 3ANDIMAR09]
MSDPWVQRVQIGDCTLYLGDALDVLPHLVGVADLVVTDPPYKLTSGGNAAQVMGGIFASDAYDNSGDLMASIGWGAMGGPIYRACKADADAYVMSNDKNLFAAHAGFTGAGWKFHNLLTWDKVRATRNRWYMKNLEFTLYLWRGRARKVRDAGSMQSFRLNAPKVSDHPTEKPVALMDHYIRNSSDLGDLVLDPFAGSGSALVAAVLAGRAAIGIELDPQHFRTACDRVAAAYAEQSKTGGDRVDQV